MTNKKSKPEIIDGHLAPNVVPFEKPKKKSRKTSSTSNGFTTKPNFSVRGWMNLTVTQRVKPVPAPS